MISSKSSEAILELDEKRNCGYKGTSTEKVSTKNGAGTEIYWGHVVTMAFFHLCAVHGLILWLTASKWYTFFWGK